MDGKNALKIENIYIIMAKECKVCFNINHSSANNCSNCGEDLPDRELTVEEKLRIELHAVKKSKEILEIALEKAHDNTELEKKDAEIRSLNKKLEQAKKEKDTEIRSLNKNLEQAKYETDQIFSEKTELEEELFNSKKKKTNSAWIFILIFGIVVLGIVCFSLMTQLREVSNSKRHFEQKFKEIGGGNEQLKNKLNEVSDDNEQLKKQNQSLKNSLTKIQDVYPFVVDKVEIGNVDYYRNPINNFGTTLYANNMRYLEVRVHYTSILEDTKYLKMFYKIYQPNGTLILQGTSKTYSNDNGETITIYPGSDFFNFPGWGNSTISTYSSGTYRIEIWYNNMCLKSTSFTLY